MLRRMPLWIVLVAHLPTWWMWYLFLSNQVRVAKKLEITLPGTLLLDKPETREAILNSFPRSLDPLFMLSSRPGASLWVLHYTALAVGLLIWVGSSRPPSSRRLALLCLSTLPLVGGFFQLPAQTVKAADAMAKAGLSFPALFGVGIGEALAFPIWGLGLSVLLALLYLKFSPRPDEAPID